MECTKCRREIVDGAAFCPYCGEKVAEEAKPLYTAEVKGLLKSGTLAVYADRVEFITSNVQRMVIVYSTLVSVKKGLDRIVFMTEDGRSESCTVNRKNIHEAFLYIDKASQPYIAARQERLLTQGVRYSLVSSMGLTGGVLNVSNEAVEFKGKAGQSETTSFREVRSAAAAMSGLELTLLDGRTKAFSLDKEVREEVAAFVREALVPYQAERKEALLAQGIYFSCLGADGGSLNIFADRAEYAQKSGRNQVLPFSKVRAVNLFGGMLEIAMVNGTARSYAVDQEVQEELLAFVEKGIRPYVEARTVGFDLSFGIDERVEVNEERGVFHIIRQGGKEITEERGMADIIRCQWVEAPLNGVIGGVLSGGMALLSAVGAGGQDPDEKMGYVGVTLTLSGEEKEEPVTVRFGDFLLGMSRTNKKYGKYLGELTRFMDYLAERYPNCERVLPPPEEEKPLPEEPSGAAAEEHPEPVEEVPAQPVMEVMEKDLFGILRYIEGVSGFIGECSAPMTIAIQGGWGSGKNSIMHMLSAKLGETCQEAPVWFSTWQFAQFDLGEQLPMLVGNRLIGLLGGTDNMAAKDRAIKVAKGLINLTTGIISQGGTDGQNLMDALFKDNSTDSLEKLVRDFAVQVQKRAGREKGKVVILVDDLDRLTPGKGVELLEAMRNFFDCDGCVFVVAVDHDWVIRGVKERYGRELDGVQGKQFFDKLFRVSFRVPTSGYNIQNYVKEQLERIDIQPDDRELGLSVSLIERSIGREPKGMERLFNSFLLLKNLADAELYQNRDRRLMLFSLLCMQSRFQAAYHALVGMKDRVTPVLLQGLQEEGTKALGLGCSSQEEEAAFRAFAGVFCDVINTGGDDGISDAESGVFARVLEFSSITSQ